MKFYENLRFVYQIQSRLREWRDSRSRMPARRPPETTDERRATACATRRRQTDPGQPGAGATTNEIGDFMNCLNHPEIPAAAFCRSCGKPLCDACKRPAHGTVYCEEHVPAADGGYVARCRVAAPPYTPATGRRTRAFLPAWRSLWA